MMEKVLGRRWCDWVRKRMIGNILVTSCARDKTILINGWNPRSLVDLHVLHWHRAHVDAVLLTGSTLRLEPELETALNVSPFAEEFEQNDQPLTLILTRDRDSLKSHPIQLPRNRCRFITFSHDNLQDDEVGLKAKGLKDMLPAIHETLNIRSISIEAGPSVVPDLWPQIDAVVLSTFEGEFVDPRALSSSCSVNWADLQRNYQRLNRVQIEDWIFSVHLRKSTLQGLNRNGDFLENRGSRAFPHSG